MTDLVTTKVSAVSAQSADLLAAVSDLAVLAPGGDGASEGRAGSGELDPYLEQLDRVGGLAGEREYAGLQTACLLFQGFLDVRSAQGDDLDDRECDALEIWPGLLHDYLTSAPGAGAVAAITNHLQLPLWDPPLVDDDVEMLQMLLREERPQAGTGEEMGSLDASLDTADTGEVYTLADPVMLTDAPPEAVEPTELEPEQPPDLIVAAAEPEAFPEVFEVAAELDESPEALVAAEEPEESPEAFAAAVEPEESLEAFEAAVVPEESLEVFEVPVEPEESLEAFEAAAESEESIEVLAPPAVEPEEYAEEDLPPEVAELVAVLLDELPLMDEALDSLLKLEKSAEGVPAGRAEATEVYADYLARFADAAESVGFSGLQQVVIQVHANLDLLTAQPRAYSASESELLAAWSVHAATYLGAPHNADACRDLIDWLKAPEWPRPLAVGQIQDLQALLQAPTLPDLGPEQEIEVRTQQATSEAVSLALPEDVNPDLLDALLQELPAQSQTFSQSIQNLIAGGSQEDIKVAQRMAHTLKGAGNTVGVYGLANLTHQLEDILVALAKEDALPTPALAMSLMNAADCLEAMGEALCGIGEPPDNAREVLQEVLDWANRIDRDGLPEADGEAPSPVAMPPTELAGQPTAVLAEAPPVASAEQPQGAAPAARTQVATELVDELLRLGGETIILSGQVHEQVRRIDERMLAMQAEFERLQRMGGELERLIDIRDLSIDRPGQEEASEFDTLEMDQYSELHTTSRMLVEAATDARQIGAIVTDQLKQLDTMLLTQERLNRESQETVFSARMVSIKTVVPRLQRSVRQTCRLTGKQVDLQLSGADTLMDGEVLSDLIDPLMHVLRNAVDHGIESPAQRTAAGKPENGTIQLDFLREGNSILVRCRDDGAGYDYPAIRRAAESRGLLEQGEAASEDELRDMLLMPNFSSRPEVTQTSGRGVGLDVVYSHVLYQGGSLALSSDSGKGSTTEMRLPLSLISTHALLVRVRGQVMAVADRGIERILHANDGKQRKLGELITFQVDDQIYPLRELDEILQLPPDNRAAQRAPMPVLLVRGRTGVTAVLVQEVLAGTDLVVKELGRHLPRLPGIIGATILGDGAVTPVLDLPELAGGARGQAAQAPTAATVALEREVPKLPRALVVDDSLSARRALVQVMEDAGYEVRAARDGMEAAQLAEALRPDIVLADMEMPRMNGIELAAHLRARPQTAGVPVIMITSRSTAKHRRQAEAAGVDVYLTKPFLDDQLLEHVAVLRGQI